MHIPEGRQWIEIVTDKLIRVLGSLRRRSKWCLSVEMPEKRSLQVQDAFLLITAPIFPTLTPYPHFQPFPRFLNQYNVFLRVHNVCRPSTSTWTHPQAYTRVFVTDRTFPSSFSHISTILTHFDLSQSFPTVISQTSNHFQVLLRTYIYLQPFSQPTAHFQSLPLTFPLFSPIFTHFHPFFHPFYIFSTVYNPSSIDWTIFNYIHSFATIF